MFSMYYTTLILCPSFENTTGSGSVYMFIFAIFTDADALAVANFRNEECKTGEVNPFDSLYFTCEISEAPYLRIVLPTGQNEVISLRATLNDLRLSPGFIPCFLRITEVDDLKGNFTLSLCIDYATRLEGGNITCSTAMKRATVGCPIGMPSFHLFTSSLT